MPSMEDLNKFEQMHHPSGHTWGLDKKIPVALIFVVVAQILIFTWQAATLSSAVNNNGDAIESIEIQLEKIGEKSDRLLIISQTKEMSRQDLDKIEKKLEAINNRVHEIERTRFTKDMWNESNK